MDGFGLNYGGRGGMESVVSDAQRQFKNSFSGAGLGSSKDQRSLERQAGLSRLIDAVSVFTNIQNGAPGHDPELP
jgi:hypothetical protein